MPALTCSTRHDPCITFWFRLIASTTPMISPGAATGPPSDHKNVGLTNTHTHTHTNNFFLHSPLFILFFLFRKSSSLLLLSLSLSLLITRHLLQSNRVMIETEPYAGQVKSKRPGLKKKKRTNSFIISGERKNGGERTNERKKKGNCSLHYSHFGLIIAIWCLASSLFFFIFFPPFACHEYIQQLCVCVCAVRVSLFIFSSFSLARWDERPVPGNDFGQ